MSGGGVSYHLRPNKHVERQLFIELLDFVVAGKNPNNYVYISMGGPQLEDHKLVHHKMGFQHLVSIEGNNAVYGRQLFNLRPSFLKCKNETTSDFVRDFDKIQEQYNDKEMIIWLDYASPKRRPQLIEYQNLLSKLQIGDILKITLNANIDTLGVKQDDETEEQIQQRRVDALLRKMADYLPTTILPDSMTNRGFIPILCEAVKIASLKALQSKPSVRAIPLAIFSYQDGFHQMLTVTVRLHKKVEVDEACSSLKKQGWDYLPSDWQNVTHINVPNLTAKERLLIEELLFSDTDENIHNKLPFRLDPSEDISLAQLKEYARHYRRYPSYFQVIL